MKAFIVTYFALFFMAWGMAAQTSEAVIGEFKVITFPEFDALTNQQSNQLRVFNFWATWCAPCVKEMPYFEDVRRNDPDIRLFFISMDDGRKTERVTDFIERRNIQSPVYLLDDVDYNKWIDKVDRDWSGAIPATLFIKPSGERYFHEGELTANELKTLIEQLKN